MGITRENNSSSPIRGTFRSLFNPDSLIKDFKFNVKLLQLGFQESHF